MTLSCPDWKTKIKTLSAMRKRSGLILSALSTILTPMLIMFVVLLFNPGSSDFYNSLTSVIRLNRFSLTPKNAAGEMKTAGLETIAVSDKTLLKPAAPSTERVNCFYSKPAEVIYDANFVGVRKKFRTLAGETFVTKVYLENTGNVPWFSDDAACGEKFRLGTFNAIDRGSIFYTNSFDTGWISKNRIKMASMRVDPGEIGEFLFTSTAPTSNDVYMEYFAPLAESVAWVSDKSFPVNVFVGEIQENAETLEMKLAYIKESVPTSGINFSGGKNISIDLSDQKMFVKIGDYIIREFSVSSGQPYKHPTPPGNYSVLYKQQVRIGGAPPFYIMPKWQSFRPDGFGLHALPSLGSAELRAKIRSYGVDADVPTSLYKNDTLWEEAVEHLGRPVSHGCVRMGPTDAAFLYDFTGIGTPVVIRN